MGLARFLRRYFLASIGATSLILLLTLLPGKDFPETKILGLDKALHLLMFGGWTLALRFDARRASGALLFGLAFLLAAGTELLQSLVPGRSADIFDLAFDLVGAALAIRFGWPLLRLADRLLVGSGGEAELDEGKEGQE